MCCTHLYDSSQPCISPLKNTPSKDAAFDNCRKNYSSNFSSFREFPNVVDWPYLHCTLNNRGGSTVSSIFIIPTKKSLILAQKLERIIILGRNFSRKINKNCKELWLYLGICTTQIFMKLFFVILGHDCEWFHESKEYHHPLVPCQTQWIFVLLRNTLFCIMYVLWLFRVWLSYEMFGWVPMLSWPNLDL